MAQQYFYDKQIRRYIQQFIRLFSGFSVQMGKNENDLPIYQQVPVRYGDINRMAAHITRENSENIVNTVPFISCYVTSLDMFAERRTYQDHVDKVQVNEKKYDEVTGKYTEELGNQYTVERHAPVPYMLVMNCDIWTSNTDQKLQLMEQILVLFNPTLDIRTNDSPLDWTSLSQVELTNTSWSTRLNMMHYYSLVNKPVIFRAHKFNFLFTLPLVKLYTEDLMYIKRGVLLQCIKSLDKSYSNINGVPKSPPNNFDTPLKEGNHTTDIILHVDIKEWLHNKNLEKIEDFFQVEYTQTMKDAVTQYYERDNVLLDKYFPNWQNQSNEQLVEQMAKIDKEYGFFSFRH